MNFENKPWHFWYSPSLAKYHDQLADDPYCGCTFPECKIMVCGEPMITRYTHACGNGYKENGGLNFLTDCVYLGEGYLYSVNGVIQE